MASLIRFLFPLVGFLCTATVITGVSTYFYLRHTGALDDEKLFRAMAIFHDVDLNQIEQKHNAEHFEVPREEQSLGQSQEQTEVALLLYEAKERDLESLLSDFNSRLDSLIAAEARNRNFKAEAEEFLTKEKNKAIDEGITAVRTQLMTMNARKQAKPLLVDMIEEGRIEQVIQLLNGMSSKKRGDILKAFDTDEDLKKLAKLQEHMLDGDPIRPYVEKQLEALNKLQE